LLDYFSFFCENTTILIPKNNGECTMAHFARLLALLSLSLITGVVQAAVLHPQVNLIGIEAVAPSEKSGDELYLAVTVYPTKGKPEHYYHPRRPLYWPSQYLERITKLALWNRELKVGESVTVLFSLIERDAPPWDADDLIGEVELQLQNTETGLNSEWSVLTRGANGKIHTHNNKADQRVATLHGQGGHYKLFLQLQLDK
jgi:hypothetical protein